MVEALENRKKLGKGELSSSAFAMKIGQAVITDDQKPVVSPSRRATS